MTDDHFSDDPKNDIVLDPFAGIGTTLAAAKQVGRRFIGCEGATVLAAYLLGRRSISCDIDPADLQ